MKYTRNIAIVAAAAGAAAIVAAPSAFAAGLNFKITAGTHTTGTANVTGTTSTITFKDTTSGQNLGCAGGTATGSVKLGASVPGAGAGSISGTTWKNCTGPNNITLLPTQVGNWSINASGKTAKGVTPLYVGNVTANVKDSSGVCTFTVVGAANGNYNNKTGNLTIKSTAAHKLTISKASCFGLINKNDNVTFQAAYKLTSKLGKIAIANA